MKTEAVFFDKEIVKQISTAQEEPKWMLEARLTAFEQISELPLPRVEKTNIQGWNFTQFKPYQQEKESTRVQSVPKGIGDLAISDTNVIIQRNSTIVYNEIDEAITAQGVIFTDLATAVKKHEALVKKYYMTIGIEKSHRLTALHSALTSGGVFLYIPANTKVVVPLHSLFLVTGKNAAMFPHILVVAEENSSVEFVTNFHGEDGAAVSNSMFEVFVGDNAYVRICAMNHFESSTVDVMYRKSVVGRGGQLHWVNCDLSEGDVISNNAVDLKGEGADLTIHSIALGVNDLRSNTTSEVHHWGKRTTSDIRARSVMKDNASNIINSITKIEHGATKSDGQQSSKVLMLDKTARGDANPILLIDENDVTAGHAASVGCVDPLQVFYLMSRGISKRQAEKLIINGFLDAVISQIPSDSFQKLIRQAIGRKF